MTKKEVHPYVKALNAELAGMDESMMRSYSTVFTDEEWEELMKELESLHGSIDQSIKDMGKVTLKGT